MALGIVNLLLLKKFFNYLFIFVCAGSSLMPGLFSSWSKWGLLFSYGAWASHCGGFSCHGVQALGYVGSVVVDPRQGIEPVPPALAGGFFATEPPGKPFFYFLKNIFICLFGCIGLGCGMWELVPQPGSNTGPPAMGGQSLSHWITREVPSLERALAFY